MFRLFVIQGVTISRAPKNPDTETDLVSLKFVDQGLRVHPSEHAVKRKRQRDRYLHPSDDGYTSRRPLFPRRETEVIHAVIQGEGPLKPENG